ncbi:MAG: hypothetical protein ACLFP6_04720 [Spirochaetaceae bacterium]
MKKTIALLLVAAFVAPVFADDALVLPKGVLRTTIAPSYGSVTQGFDKDGNREDLVDLSGGFIDSFTIWTLSAALEYGITDEINIAAQWAPGWQFAGSVAAGEDVPEPNATTLENGQPTGLNDLFLGAKAQILGPSGFVPNESMRFAAAAGFIVPLSVYDADEVAENQAAGDEYQAGRVGNDTFATGFRLYYDYIFSDSFFWNLYSEFIYFFPRDLEQLGGNEEEVAPGTEFTVETEPDFSTMVADGLEFGASLPLTYTITGESELAGTAQEDSTTLLTIAPTVSLFFQSLPVPTQLDLSYQAALHGTGDEENYASAANVFVLQVKNFLRF